MEGIEYPVRVRVSRIAMEEREVHRNTHHTAETCNQSRPRSYTMDRTVVFIHAPPSWVLAGLLCFHRNIRKSEGLWHHTVCSISMRMRRTWESKVTQSHRGENDAEVQWTSAWLRNTGPGSKVGYSRTHEFTQRLRTCIQKAWSGDFRHLRFYRLEMQTLICCAHTILFLKRNFQFAQIKRSEPLIIIGHGDGMQHSFGTSIQAPCENAILGTPLLYIGMKPTCVKLHSCYWGFETYPTSPR